MKILELSLYSSNIAAQKDFYENVLGFELLDNQKKSFVVQVGTTRLEFVESEISYKYHYCFLIPNNQLSASIDWLKDRTELVKIEGKRITQLFDDWNAESVYFFDGDGNIAEFIVRYDMDNSSDKAFGIDQILNVNEIGMPTDDIAVVFKLLNDKTGISFYKGNLERFGTAGTAEGIFLLVNNVVKEIWFPTTLKTDFADFKMKLEVKERQYKLNYQDGMLSFEE